jgi:cytochrome c6
MRGNSFRVLMIATLATLVMSLSGLAIAQDGAATYKTKCAMCHGADGSKIAAHNLQGDDVQKLSDADLSTIITNGKGKMPAIHGVTADQVKSLVDFVRTLKK